MTVPTHNRPHILDSVISHGLHINGLTVDETVISNRFPVLFNFDCPETIMMKHVTLCRKRVISSATAERFSKNLSKLHSPALLYNNPDDAFRAFRSVCHTVMDIMAPLRIRQPKSKSAPF